MGMTVPFDLCSFFLVMVMLRECSTMKSVSSTTVSSILILPETASSN